MAAAHTPGPWKWWTSNSQRRLGSGDGASQRDGNVLYAHPCRDRGADGYVSEADMALIAAAPEMYEALQRVVEQFGHTHKDLLAIEKAWAAIAKAEGRA